MRFRSPPNRPPAAVRFRGPDPACFRSREAAHHSPSIFHQSSPTGIQIAKLATEA